MQTEESVEGLAGSELDDDNVVIEVEDSLHDDIAETYDELALKDSEGKADEPEVKAEEDNAEDDIQAAVKELKAKANDTDKADSKEKTAQLDTKPAVDAKTKAKDDLIPPQGMTVEEKEEFNSLPDKLKPAAKRTFNNYQAHFTRAMQAVSEDKKKVETERSMNSELTKTMNRYLTKWGANGVAPEQAIMALASVQDELTHPDKEMRKSAYARLLVSSGLEPEDFAEILGGEVIQKQAPQNNVQPVHLTEEEKQRQYYIDSLIAKDRQAAQQAEQSTVQTAMQEIESVRELKDPRSGRYIYPKLHDQSFIEQAKPLVLAIMRTTGVSWGEAFKRAYSTLEPDSAINQTRLSSENNRSGATIVRNSPTVRSSGQPAAFPDFGKDDGGTLDDDVKWAAEYLKRGGAGHY